MFKRFVLWYKIIAILAVMTLIIPVLAACGGGDDETSEPTAVHTMTSGPTATTAPASTSTPAGSADPVKIGAISPWSGPMSVSGMYYADPVIKLVESQVKQNGGILGGRLIKIVKYDNRGAVAEASAGATKLITEDKVATLVFGGASGAEMRAVSDQAENSKILFVAFANLGDLSEKKYSVVAAASGNTIRNNMLQIAQSFKPATLGFLFQDDVNHREIFDYAKPKAEAAGMKVVYSQFVPIEVNDYTPYLTKIKYNSPDVMILSTLSEGFVTIAKQMKELGGWGNTKVLCFPGAIMAAKGQAGTKGWNIMVSWYPGRDYPASQKFEQEFQSINGRAPDSNHVYYYLALWTALHAIELAGTDEPVAIAQAARSGNLEWDTPAGLCRIQTDGYSNLSYSAVNVQEPGKFVPFDF